MCLENAGDLQVADTDITVYKLIYAVPHYENIDCEPFTAIIRGKKRKGIIRVHKNCVFFCTNDYDLDGCNIPEDYKMGYRYSWAFDNNVDIKTIRIRGRFIKRGYATYYRNFLITIGETYRSKLKVSYDYGKTVREGLHSFEDIPKALIGTKIIQCTIPKGSKYYVGKFIYNVSYASDTLRYDKLLK